MPFSPSIIGKQIRLKLDHDTKRVVKKILKDKLTREESLQVHKAGQPENIKSITLVEFCEKWENC